MTSRIEGRHRSLIIVLIICLLSVSSRAATTQPAFQLRGIKGLWWDGMEKYRLALPWIAEHNMNFLMFCYSSFPASGKDWRADYSADEQAGFRELAARADKLAVELCLSFNPGIWSTPALTYASEEDYQLAWKKVKAVHALGVHSFALCLDDINTKLQPADAERFQKLEAAQVYFVNRLWSDMKSLSPRPRFIFCPSAYNTVEAEKHLEYTKKLAELDPDIFMFWTGPGTCASTITAEDANHIASLLGRKPIIWDNYPVNDMFPWRPLLAPVKGRSPDLGNSVVGLMANPMKQWEASKIPLATLAMYLTDPAAYDPSTARKEVVKSFPLDQRPTIDALMSLYGTRFLGDTGYPPQPGHDRATAPAQLKQYRSLRQMLASSPSLKTLWADVQPTLDADIAKLLTLTASAAN